MKNIGKKFGTLALIVVMLTGTALATYTDQAQIQYPQAVEIVTELGIFQGKEDSSFDPAAAVTRGEMCTILSSILNGGKLPALEERVSFSYTDTGNHWARYYIEYCNTLGIVNGRGDGTFDPDGGVTGREAAKMLLVTAGYDVKKSGFTGADWATSVDELAEAQGLYTGLPQDCQKRSLTRDETAQMVYNALSVEMVAFWDRVVGPDGDWEPEVVQLDTPRALGMTLLENFFQMDLNNGTLTPIES